MTANERRRPVGRGAVARHYTERCQHSARSGALGALVVDPTDVSAVPGFVAALRSLGGAG